MVHLDDGLAQAGQRDFALAVLAMMGCAILLRLYPARPLLALCLFEFVIGFTATVKPTLLLASLAPLLLKQPACRARFSLSKIVLGSISLILPLVLTAGWLASQHAVASYLEVMSTAGRIHALLGRRSLVYLLSHCAAPVTILFLPWAAAQLVARPRLTDRRRLLLAFAGVGLLSYLAQGKGLPYHRYPFLAFLLLLVASDLEEALASSRGMVAAALAAGITCLWFGPSMTSDVLSFGASAPFEESLAAEMTTLGVRDNNVQCLDTFGGCINTLYDLALLQSTGYLYDCYLFSGPSPERKRYREGFLQAFEASKPRFVVLTSQYCFSASSYKKVDTWPELTSLLSTDYTAIQAWTPRTPERWWHRSELPPSYRIFRLK